MYIYSFVFIILQLKVNIQCHHQLPVGGMCMSSKILADMLYALGVLSMFLLIYSSLAFEYNTKECFCIIERPLVTAVYYTKKLSIIRYSAFVCMVIHVLYTFNSIELPGSTITAVWLYFASTKLANTPGSRSITGHVL